MTVSSDVEIIESSSAGVTASMLAAGLVLMVVVVVVVVVRVGVVCEACCQGQELSRPVLPKVIAKEDRLCELWTAGHCDLCEEGVDGLYSLRCRCQVVSKNQSTRSV